MVANGVGMPHLRRIILPHPLEDKPEADVREALRAKLNELVANLTDSLVVNPPKVRR